MPEEAKDSSPKSADPAKIEAVLAHYRRRLELRRLARGGVFLLPISLFFVGFFAIETIGRDLEFSDYLIRGAVFLAVAIVFVWMAKPRPDQADAALSADFHGGGQGAVALFQSHPERASLPEPLRQQALGALIRASSDKRPLTMLPYLMVSTLIGVATLVLGFAGLAYFGSPSDRAADMGTAYIEGSADKSDEKRAFVAPNWQEEARSKALAIRLNEESSAETQSKVTEHKIKAEGLNAKRDAAEKLMLALEKGDEAEIAKVKEAFRAELGALPTPAPESSLDWKALAEKTLEETKLELVKVSASLSAAKASLAKLAKDAKALRDGPKGASTGGESSGDADRRYEAWPIQRERISKELWESPKIRSWAETRQGMATAARYRDALASRKPE